MQEQHHGHEEPKSFEPERVDVPSRTSQESLAGTEKKDDYHLKKGENISQTDPNKHTIFVRLGWCCLLVQTILQPLLLMSSSTVRCSHYHNDHGNWKDLFRACGDNEEALIRYYLEQTQVDQTFQHPEYMSAPIFEALRQGHANVVDVLVHHHYQLEQQRSHNQKEFTNNNKNGNDNNIHHSSLSSLLLLKEQFTDCTPMEYALHHGLHSMVTHLLQYYYHHDDSTTPTTTTKSLLPTSQYQLVQTITVVLPLWVDPKDANGTQQNLLQSTLQTKLETNNNHTKSSMSSLSSPSSKKRAYPNAYSVIHSILKQGHCVVVMVVMVEDTSHMKPTKERAAECTIKKSTQLVQDFVKSLQQATGNDKVRGVLVQEDEQCSFEDLQSHQNTNNTPLGETPLPTVGVNRVLLLLPPPTTDHQSVECCVTGNKKDGGTFPFALGPLWATVSNQLSRHHQSLFTKAPPHHPKQPPSPRLIVTTPPTGSSSRLSRNDTNTVNSSEEERAEFGQSLYRHLDGVKNKGGMPNEIHVIQGIVTHAVRGWSWLDPLQWWWDWVVHVFWTSSLQPLVDAFTDPFSLADSENGTTMAAPTVSSSLADMYQHTLVSLAVAAPQNSCTDTPTVVVHSIREQEPLQRSNDSDKNNQNRKPEARTDGVKWEVHETRHMEG